MKKFILLGASILVFASLGLGQKQAPDFAATWNLDLAKSELGRRPIKSMVMTVKQTESELSYERNAEFESEAGAGSGRRGMGPGRAGGGEQALTFDLNGGETTSPAAGGMGGSSKLFAKMDGSKLKVTQKREFEGPMGAMTIKTVETWSLSEDGQTLTVSSETETPRGTRSSNMVFVRSTN